MGQVYYLITRDRCAQNAERLCFGVGKSAYCQTANRPCALMILPIPLRQPARLRADLGETAAYSGDAVYRVQVSIVVANPILRDVGAAVGAHRSQIAPEST